MATFALQLGHPKIKQNSFPVFRELRNTFNSLFSFSEESFFLFWHQIPIRLRYREELYHNFDAILAMAWLLQKEERGVNKVDFMTQLLFIHWELHWEHDDLLIKARFTDTEDLYAPYAAALNRMPELRMSKAQFLREWKMLLQQVIVCIETADITIEDGKERRKWELLQRVDHQIEGYGVLYQRQPV